LNPLSGLFEETAQVITNESLALVAGAGFEPTTFGL